MTPPRAGRRGSPLAGRAAWTLADQVVSSLGSASLSFLVARAVDPTAFGRFSLSYSAFAFLAGVSAAVAVTPVQVRFAGAVGVAARRAAGAATGTAAAVGVIAGGVIALGSLMAGGALRAVLLGVAVSLPALLAAEAGRSVLRAGGRPRGAFALDLCYSAVQLGAVAGLTVAGVRSVTVLELAWGGAAAVGALVGVHLLSTRPTTSAVRPWLAAHRDLWRWLLADWVLVLGSQQVALALVATVGAVAEVGSLRAATVLLGPLNVLSLSAFAFVVPELARRPHLSSRILVRVAAGTSTVLVLGAAAWSAVLLLVPDSAGRALLGSTWPGAHGVLLPMTIALCGTFAGAGPGAVLLSGARPQTSFRIGLVQAPLSVVLAVVGVRVDGARGAAWGLAAAQWSTVPLWAARVWLDARRGRLRITPPPADAVLDDAAGPPGGEMAGVAGPAGAEHP